ncbi:MAG: DUF4974 domain-containing protein [Dysgonamonadaceae bacterium]|jgi:ferric-dicitrate binding protein FerR (iron transport regulator)|nr:DUF4974 domain-containing protein [Dysgonamonadaceae bacterium]
MIDEFNTINNDSDFDAALFIKYLQRLTTSEETLLVENRMNENEEHKKEARQIAEIFFTKRTYDRMAMRNVDLAYHKVQSHFQKKKTLSWKKPFLYAAASLAGAIILSSTSIFFIQKEVIPGKTNLVTVEANPGMHSRVNLADGTIVYLNSGSKLSYPDQFNGNERNVKLDGEAFFQVKKNTEKPFVVYTNDNTASIKVLGTSFNVQCFENDNEFTTTLVDGSVDITINRKNGSTTSTKLTPSEKFVFDKNTDKFTVGKVETEIETAWTKNRFIFKNLPMPQVLKILAYNYNVEFIIKNSTIDTYRFTGTFQSRQLPQILEYLKISSNINYTMRYPHSEDSLDIKKTQIILY